MSLWWNKTEGRARVIYSVGVLPCLIAILGLVIGIIAINLAWFLH